MTKSEFSLKPLFKILQNIDTFVSQQAYFQVQSAHVVYKILPIRYISKDRKCKKPQVQVIADILKFVYYFTLCYLFNVLTAF